MAVQVSYPGVYIEEFTPASPIEGVSTSIAAFIGIAEKGPILEATILTSFDAFTDTFGGPLDGPQPYYLPLAVQGFFANGGTIAYVIRVGAATPARAELKTRDTAPKTMANVLAIADGAAGNGGQVVVTDSSALATALTDAHAGTSVPAHRAEEAVTHVDATRRELTVGDSSGFQAGDNVVLSRGADKSPRLAVASVGPGVVKLASDAPAAPAAGEWNSVTTADLGVGDRVIRVDVPAAVSLRAQAPAGSVVVIADGHRSEWHIASEVGADSFTLSTPLAAGFDISTMTVATAEFDLAITDPAHVTRTYAGLSTSPTHPRWWGTAIAEPYARVSLVDGVFPDGDPRPKRDTLSITGATNDDAATSWGWVQDETKLRDYLKLLEPIDEVSLVAVPGCTRIEAQQEIVLHCEKMFDRFAILDSKQKVDLPTVKAQRASLTGQLNKGFAALYYPWITVKDPSRNAVVPQPPSGHIAGIYAHTDNTRGVHKAPANVGIAGASSVERRLSDIDQGFINPDGVNALRILPGRGMPVVYGARTTAGDSNWQYINIRRLFLFLEESIQESLSLSVFEPNDLALWQKLKRTITEFLTRVWRDGALFGATAKDAFYVRIYEALNPPSTRKLGRLYIEIGVQPVYPAEFIVVRIGIWDGGSEVAEA
ncbi:MAG: phage tail sheath family protein [Frankiaceae bacterium]